MTHLTDREKEIGERFPRGVSGHGDVGYLLTQLGKEREARETAVEVAREVADLTEKNDRDFALRVGLAEIAEILKGEKP